MMMPSHRLSGACPFKLDTLENPYIKQRWHYIMSQALTLFSPVAKSGWFSLKVSWVTKQAYQQLHAMPGPGEAGALENVKDNRH